MLGDSLTSGYGLPQNYSVPKVLEKKLQIKVGESTKDNKFFLKDEIECLAACCDAPMMQVNHKNVENLTTEKVDQILEELS